MVHAPLWTYTATHKCTCRWTHAEQTQHPHPLKYNVGTIRTGQSGPSSKPVSLAKWIYWRLITYHCTPHTCILTHVHSRIVSNEYYHRLLERYEMERNACVHTTLLQLIQNVHLNHSGLPVWTRYMYTVQREIFVGWKILYIWYEYMYFDMNKKCTKNSLLRVEISPVRVD